MPALSSAQPMSPGRSSQKYLRSNVPTRGLSSRPMKRSYTSEPLSPPSASSAPRRSEATYSASESANEKATAALMSGRYAS